MPAVDVLISRVNRQLAEVEQSLRRLEEDLSDTSCVASISASLGTLSRSMNDLEQVLKRETMFKEQYKTYTNVFHFRSFKECELKCAKYKTQFDSLKSQRLESERRRRRNELLPEDTMPLVPNSENYYTHERAVVNNSNTQVDQVIEVGGYTLERLRNQGKTMKVSMTFAYF